jgi:hypothetical protein
VFRTVVLGDSTTWGTGPAEEAWPRQAERRLGSGHEVLNLSHYGYDVAQIAAVLREDVPALRPDLVIYAAYTNDPVPTRAIDVGGGTVWVASEGLFPRPLRRASAVVRRVEGAMLRGRLDDAPDWDVYARGLGEIAAAADELGAKLLVLGLAPWALAAEDSSCDAGCRAHADRERRQAEMSAARGLVHVRALPALTEAARAGRDLAPSDRRDWQHAGRDGHAVIAELAVTSIAAVRGLRDTPIVP